MTVPGVRTRMMSRLTRPFALEGSSTCSQMATLYPLAIEPGHIAFIAVEGHTALGARSGRPHCLPVRVRSSSREAVKAHPQRTSHKNPRYGKRRSTLYAAALLISIYCCIMGGSCSVGGKALPIRGYSFRYCSLRLGKAESGAFPAGAADTCSIGQSRTPFLRLLQLENAAHRGPRFVNWPVYRSGHI